LDATLRSAKAEGELSRAKSLITALVIQPLEVFRIAAGSMEGSMRREGNTLKNRWRQGSQR
jgi:hypothetical protein